MALLTSYRYRGLELNDGISYAVPNNGHTLDDRQPAEETWVYRRGGDLPMATGITLKEGVIALPIHVIASTGQDFQTKLEALLKAFDTTDARYFKFERKLPHEQYYRYIEVAPRQVTVSRTERKVTVTLYTPERAWKEDTWQSVAQIVFVNSGRDETFNVTYNGLVPVEPIVEVKPLIAGTGDTPQPMYFREVDVYVPGAFFAYKTPVCVVKNWNTNTLVTAGKMRADGKDITLAHADGTPIDRWVGGTQAARAVWALADHWPTPGADIKLSGTMGQYNASSTELPIVCMSGSLSALPTSSKIAIGDEILSYSGIQITSADGKFGKLTGLQRGLDGTTAINFSAGDYNWNLVKFPTTVRVYYGYAPNFASQGIFENQIDQDWHLIDFGSSDNKTWVQSTANTSPGSYVNGWGYSGRQLSWFYQRWLSGRAGERSYARTTGSVAGGTGKLALSAHKGGSTGASYRSRLLVALLPSTTRQVTRARLEYTLTAGDSGQFPGIQAVMGVTRSGFNDRFSIDPKTGEVSTYERYDVLHTTTVLSGTLAADTGWQNIKQEWDGATHIWLYVSECPTNSVADQVKLTLNTVSYALDEEWRAWPVTYMRPTERGLAYGEYPVVLTWQNLSDTHEPDSFSIWPQIATNATVAYDCASYTVTNEPLGSCTYAKPKWLRLVPGVNTIRVMGAAGTGRTQLTVKWKNKH